MSSRSKTNEEFINEVKKLVGNDYTFLEEYKYALEKIKVKHNKCGHVYYVTPSNFLRGRRCPNCKGKRISNSKTRDTEYFKNKVAELVGKEYTVIGEYQKANTPILLIHNKCGRKFKMSPGHFVDGERCPYCGYARRAKLKMKTQDEFKNNIKENLGNSYILLSKYKGDSVPVTLVHTKCGHKYKARPSGIVQGRLACPYCNQPVGERLITKYLDNLSIEYEIQKRFDGLKIVKDLSYDFYIPKYKMLIEYQGIQHYKPRSHFGGVKTFRKQVIHDKVKSEYATNNGYILVKVPYICNKYSKVTSFLNTVFINNM